MNIIFKYLLLALLLLIFNRIEAADKKAIKNDTTIRIESKEHVYSEKQKGIGGNLFLGYGYLNGNISKYFSNPFFIGLSIDIIRQKIVFQIDDYIGFGETKRSMDFPNNQKWVENKFAFHGMFGGNLGYSLSISESIKIVPLAGIGLGLLSANPLQTSDYEPTLPYYKLGCYLDLKSIKIFRRNYSFNDSNSYTCARLSFGINSSIGKPKYDSFFNGRMIYITLGMGGLSLE